MVKVCIHYPVNPEKAGLCVKLLAHENNETTDLVMPFADDPNQLSSALDNMVKEKYISAKAKREIYEQIKRETLDRCMEEMRQPVWALPEPPVVQGNGLNLNDPRIQEIVINYRD